MTGFEVAQELMTEIGPAMELSEVTEFTEDESWVLVVDDETVIAVDHDGDLGKLTLSVEVATPPAEHRLAVYEQLLAFNYQWPETGGQRFATESPDGGAVVLLVDLPLAGLDLTKLQATVGGFLSQVPLWRNLITQVLGSGASIEADTPLPVGMPGEGIIRA